MRWMLRLVLLGLSICVVPFAVQAQAEVKEISVRPGVTLRFVYVKADNPVASAVLFPGGSGHLDISADGSMKGDGSFITVGGAKRFTQNGISVVVPAVPSDRSNLNGFRYSKEHAQDNAALFEFLKQQANVPVWAVGTSNSSLSAVAASIQLQEKGPHGIVLTSSVTSILPNPIVHSVMTVPLEQVKVPVLIVHAKKDVDCRFSPYSAMPELVAAFKAAPKVELLSVEGGFAMGRYPPCATGFHQFNGIEDAVTKDIADWIKRN